MDTNTKSQTNDLIAGKTAEYDKLPGLILGLDGWILRSVPKELRHQFLNGYEKLLKIVFHPDRYQEPKTKQSRQTFLQSVGEAVRFMLADEFAFEITADSVPSKKNPMVSLREAIQIRDNIISNIDDKLDDKSETIKSLSLEVDRLRNQLHKAISDSDRRAKIDHQLKAIVRTTIKKFPVPIGLKHCAVTGRFLELRESFMAQDIARFSSSANISDDSIWVTEAKWISGLNIEKSTGPVMTFRFNRATAETDDMHCTQIGGMTIAHLCEFIRAFHDYPDSLEAIGTMQAINWLTTFVDPTKTQMEFHIRASPFLLSYYAPNMLLLLRVKSKGLIRRRLFVVTDVDAGDGPLKAVANGLQRENDGLRRTIFQRGQEITRLKKLLKHHQNKSN